jgi:hypothetical protein
MEQVDSQIILAGQDEVYLICPMVKNPHLGGLISKEESYFSVEVSL